MGHEVERYQRDASLFQHIILVLVSKFAQRRHRFKPSQWRSEGPGRELGEGGGIAQSVLAGLRGRGGEARKGRGLRNHCGPSR